ncbi:hypothetical protein PENTCL1PPCAC_30039, partial [Pristionchus entomophagus]
LVLADFVGRAMTMRMSDELWDVVVIGSGIFGTCAAYHAAKQGLRTLKIDQHSFGHRKGSSHGSSRIIRYAHSNPAWIPIVKDTYEQIAELEKIRDEKLWLNTGLVWMGSEEYVNKLGKTIGDAGCNHEILDNEQINQRFPLFTYDKQWKGLFDPMGGVILADKWMWAFHNEFLRHGGAYIDWIKITQIEQGDIITLHSQYYDSIRCKKLIVAAGSWVNELVPSLNVKSKNLALSVCYWKPKEEKNAPLVSPDKMPVFIIDDQFDGGRGYFGIPTVDYPGAIKFGEHGGDQFAPGDEPETHDKIFVERPRQHLQKHWPLMDSEEPFRVDHCKYTMSPDGAYLIDYLGDNKNIVLCSMLSGTGFKCAPALGRIVTDMVQGKEPPIDISVFRAGRFGEPFSQ